MHIHSIYIILSNTYDIEQASFLVLVKVLNICRLKFIFHCIPFYPIFSLVLSLSFFFFWPTLGPVC